MSNKNTLNITMIGAGGIASYLFPLLVRTFDLAGLLYDKDRLEKRNLDRQHFSELQIGQNKAKALLHLYEGHRVKAQTEFFRMGLPLANNCDVIICCADNHPTRRECIEVAQAFGVPLLIAANDLFDAQAYLYDPAKAADFSPQYKPQVRYPEIMTSDQGSPFACTGPEAEEAAPQLAIANASAAAYAAQLLYTNFCIKQNNPKNYPYELGHSTTGNYEISEQPAFEGAIHAS